MSSGEWNTVHKLHTDRFPTKERTVDSLCRKFNLLKNSHMGTGDPECPSAVRTAKRIAYNIRNRCEIAVDSDFSLVVGEDTDNEEDGGDDGNGKGESEGSENGNDSDENRSQNLLEPEHNTNTKEDSIGTFSVTNTTNVETGGISEVTPLSDGMYLIIDYFHLSHSFD